MQTQQQKIRALGGRNWEKKVKKFRPLNDERANLSSEKGISY